MISKRKGLDVDGVLCNFTQGVLKRARKMGLGEYFPRTWRGTKYWNMSEKFSDVMRDVWEDPKFWLDLEPLATEVPFEVDCYITSRLVPSEVTKAWLFKHGFPEADVITVKTPTEKLQHILDRHVDIFVDDLYSTVKELREAGVNALLYSAPYQRGHVEECKGLPTIKSLTEVLNYD